MRNKWCRICCEEVSSSGDLVSSVIAHLSEMFIILHVCDGFWELKLRALVVRVRSVDDRSTCTECPRDDDMASGVPIPSTIVTHTIAM
jgi:hypothetical protein